MENIPKELYQVILKLSTDKKLIKNKQIYNVTKEEGFGFKVEVGINMILDNDKINIRKIFQKHIVSGTKEYLIPSKKIFGFVYEKEKIENLEIFEKVFYYVVSFNKKSYTISFDEYDLIIENYRKTIEEIEANKLTDLVKKYLT